MSRHRGIAAFMISIAMVFVAMDASSQQQFTFKQMVRTGDAAPVPQELAFVNQFSLNAQGQAEFLADGGLFLESNGVTSLVAAFGDPVPGGGTLVHVTTPAMDPNGNIVFRAQVTVPSKSGLYLASGGVMTLFLADGTAASSGDVVFPSSPAINGSGTVAFVSLTGNGLFLDSNGTVSRIARPGDPAPGGSTFLRFASPAINSSGQVVFTGTLANGRQGFFLASGGVITKIIATGDVFPDGGVVASLLSPIPSINDAGDVAFTAASNGPAADSGVFLFSGGTLTVVVPAFTPIPSLGGVLLQPQFASLNNSGQIAFLSQQIPQSGFGLSVFVYSAGNVTLAMAPGQSSPDGDTFTGAFIAQINDSGQVGFLARLLQENDALFVFSGNQTARLAGQGDPVARQPQLEVPFAFGLSNRDQALVFDATFPGGNGLFSASRRHHHEVILDAHVSQSVGSDGQIQGFFENFVMNSQGQVAMNVNLSSGISSILLSSASGPTELVRASLTGGGDPAPSGGTFLGLRWLSINNLGAVAFSAFDSLQSGLYVVANGQTTLAIPSSASLPGGGGIFSTITLNAINDSGQIAFFAQPFPGPNGMFLFANGQFTSLARAGTPAPGGGNFRLVVPDPRLGPVISNNGDVAFADDLSTGGRAVFLYSGGTLSRVAGPGDASPDGSTFTRADAPSINASGQIAFTGVTAAHGSGAFLYSGGTITKVAAPGDQLPHKVTLTFVDRPQVNDLGEVAFGADLSTGEVALFLAKLDDDGEEDENVVLAPGPAPQTPEGFLELMKARHPRNFEVEESPDEPIHQ